MPDRLEGTDQGRSAGASGDDSPADASRARACPTAPGARRSCCRRPISASHPPEVTIENGAIEIIDPPKTPASTLALRDVNMALDCPAQDGCQPVPGGEQPAPTVRRFRGRWPATVFAASNFEGWLDVQTAACSFRGKAEGVEISPELRDSLPEPLATKLSPLGDLRGQADLAFQVDYDPAAAVPLRFDVSGQLARGRIDDPRLPQALTDIRAAVRLNNAGYAIDDLTARSGRPRCGCRAGGRVSSRPARWR